MHCAGRQCALCDQMKVAQRTKKALKDTPRESYQLFAHGDDGAVR